MTRDVLFEVLIMFGVFGVGAALALPLQNPPLTAGTLTLAAYLVTWTFLSRFKYDTWWADREDMMLQNHDN
jgi:hypothetical protein